MSFSFLHVSYRIFLPTIDGLPFPLSLSAEILRPFSTVGTCPSSKAFFGCYGLVGDKAMHRGGALRVDDHCLGMGSSDKSEAFYIWEQRPNLLWTILKVDVHVWNVGLAFVYGSRSSLKVFSIGLPVGCFDFMPQIRPSNFTDSQRAFQCFCTIPPRGLFP